MAAKYWESDIRYASIQSSLALFADEIPDGVFSIPHSFCLPIAERPIVGFTPGKAMLFFLVFGFSLLGLSLWIISEVDDKAPMAANPIVWAFGPLCTIAGIACFFVPSVFAKQLVSTFLGKRGRELRDRAGASALHVCELGDGDSSKQSISIDGDDHVLIFMDRTNRRMLIEGIGARYQIRGQDVRKDVLLSSIPFARMAETTSFLLFPFSSSNLNQIVQHADGQHFRE